MAAGAFALLFVDFVDELGSGIPVADAPTIRSELGLEYAGTSWFLLAAPLALSIVLETPLLLLSDRWPRRRMIAIGLGVMALCLALAGVSTSPWMLAAAFAVWAAAGGVGVGVAQAALMAAFPHDRERMMTRWTLMGMLGDAATPLLLLGTAALGLDWRAAMLTAAALHLVAAIAIATTRSETEAEEASESDSDSDSASAWARLRAGLRNRRLLLWLGATALCCLLDEILVAFGTLFLRDTLGATAFEQGLLVLAFAVGGGAGLLATDRVLHRVRPMKLLAVSGLTCAAAFALWLAATSVHVSLALAFVVGFAGAPLYPITQARAYAMEPDRPGVVRAIDQIYAPVPVLAPIAVGFVADHVGLVIALAILLLEPVGLGLLALASLRDANAPTGDRG